MSPSERESQPPPLDLPRGLVFGASAWLAASWIISIGIRPPVQPTSISYTPAARMLVVATMIGIIIAWPLLRLSASRPTRPLMSAMLDTVSLVALTQIVIWPLRLVTTWSVTRNLTISLDLLACSIFVGGLLALTAATRRGGTAWMLALMGLVVVPPLLGLVVPMDPIHSPSPLVRIWALAGGGPGPLGTAAWSGGAFMAAMGVALWLTAARISPSPLADQDGLR